MKAGIFTRANNVYKQFYFDNISGMKLAYYFSYFYLIGFFMFSDTPWLTQALNIVTNDGQTYILMLVLHTIGLGLLTGALTLEWEFRAMCEFYRQKPARVDYPALITATAILSTVVSVLLLKMNVIAIMQNNPEFSVYPHVFIGVGVFMYVANGILKLNELPCQNECVMPKT